MCDTGKLQGLMSTVAGRNVYLRFNCFAGDAMGMNMVSKGVLAVIDLLQEVNGVLLMKYCSMGKAAPLIARRER